MTPAQRSCRRVATVLGLSAAVAALATCSCSRSAKPTSATDSAELSPLPVTAPSAPQDDRYWERPVRYDELCITQGALASLTPARYAVTQAKMRAVLGQPTPSLGELRFVYLGPTTETLALESGAMRRQIGLKLRARDGCNVVYVMWRMEPDPRLVVSVKVNPDKHTSRECGSAGYLPMRARREGPLPASPVGTMHALRAELTGDELEVTVDGSVVWEGALGPEARTFDGPVGVRTDNGRFDFELIAAMPSRSNEMKAVLPQHCRRVLD